MPCRGRRAARPRRPSGSSSRRRGRPTPCALGRAPAGGLIPGTVLGEHVGLFERRLGLSFYSRDTHSVADPTAATDTLRHRRSDHPADHAVFVQFQPEMTPSSAPRYLRRAGATFGRRSHGCCRAACAWDEEGARSCWRRDGFGGDHSTHHLGDTGYSASACISRNGTSIKAPSRSSSITTASVDTSMSRCCCQVAGS